MMQQVIAKQKVKMIFWYLCLGKKLSVSCIKLPMKGIFFFFLNEQIVLCFLLKINTTQNEEIILLYPEDALDIKHQYITIE